MDFVRAGAFTSMIWFELVVMGFLWILWVATAVEADAARKLLFAGISCSSFSERRACLGSYFAHVCIP
jgi:hypothetical protein